MEFFEALSGLFFELPRAVSPNDVDDPSLTVGFFVAIGKSSLDSPFFVERGLGLSV